MRQFCFMRSYVSIFAVLVVAALWAVSAPTAARAQAIVSCAAPSSALGEAYATVNADQEQVNVRSGPNSFQFARVGVLLTYESAPVLGRSPGGDWLQISCPGSVGGSGWIYAANVTLTASGELPVVVIPATATPPATSTVDPALAAQFPPAAPTLQRLPTFTPAAPQPLPTFNEPPSKVPLPRNVPGSLILAAAALGLVIFLLSFFARR
ncbi:MAG TPA: SH3 domain-containing protein [Anaerolineales bacterium]|nr:SH3 domain-containing protein [Anaerolineales bacterium]